MDKILIILSQLSHKSDHNYIISFLSLEISHCFFADDYIDKSFILTYDVFAIAYISRPLGGLFFFGLLADRRGGEALSFLAPSCWELQQPS